MNSKSAAFIEEVRQAELEPGDKLLFNLLRASDRELSCDERGVSENPRPVSRFRPTILMFQTHEDIPWKNICGFSYIASCSCTGSGIANALTLWKEKSTMTHGPVINQPRENGPANSPMTTFQYR
jgi:hypothetical protein